MSEIKLFRKLTVVAASFGIMMCLGGVYAWSIFVPHLIDEYQLSSTQTQAIFGLLIAVFPVTMIFAGKLESRLKPATMARISALFFLLGYGLAGFSNGSFLLLLLGIGVLVGISTGFGYIVALSSPIQWFPGKKGLVTGIAAAGFGLAAVALSQWVEYAFNTFDDVMHIFRLIAVFYSVILFVLSFFIIVPGKKKASHLYNILDLLKEAPFLRLLVGIFLGTFAGLLVIGNLKPIGAQSDINNSLLVLGISLFAIANFLGRLTWGFLSDFISTRICLLMALFLQALPIFVLSWSLSPLMYLVCAASIGFSFGANFVLFAKETSNIYGMEHLNQVYPFVFLGYALAGIFGPVSGGLLFDVYQSYSTSVILAAVVSFIGGLLFLFRLEKPRQ